MITLYSWCITASIRACRDTVVLLIGGGGGVGGVGVLGVVPRRKDFIVCFR